MNSSPQHSFVEIRPFFVTVGGRKTSATTKFFLLCFSHKFVKQFPQQIEKLLMA